MLNIPNQGPTQMIKDAQGHKTPIIKINDLNLREK